MLFTHGAFAFGDYVTPGPTYALRTLGAWDPFEHAGEPVALNLSQAPTLLIGMALGKVIGMAGYDKLCVALSFFVAIFSVMCLLRRVVPKIEFPVAGLLGIFYAFNPWSAAHIASGHLALYWAYALTPLLLRCAYVSGLNGAILGAFVFAVLCANDFHAGELAAFSYMVLVLAEYGAEKRSMLTLACTLGAGVGLSLWWALGVLTAPGVHLPAQNPGAEAALARNASLLNTLMLRNYWWNQFSQGLYVFHSGIGTFFVSVACLVPSAFTLAGMVMVFRNRKTRVGFSFAALWIVATCVVCVSYYAPAVFATLLRLPLMAPFRDPSKLLPLMTLSSVVVLAIASSDLGSAARRVCVAIFALGLLGATSAWWWTGDLRGQVRPLDFPGADFTAAMSWVDAHGADANTLWIPIGPYVAYDWFPYGAQDPVRFYARTPTLNPYYDPTYDFSPGTSTFLESIEQGIRMKTLPYLGHALAPYGVRYIVVRTDAWPLPPPLPRHTGALNWVHDLSLVKRFGAILVYENRLWRSGRLQLSSIATYASPSFEWARGTLPLDAQDRFIVDDPEINHAAEILDGGQIMTRLTNGLMRDDTLRAVKQYGSGWRSGADPGSYTSVVSLEPGALEYAVPKAGGYLIAQITGRSPGLVLREGETTLTGIAGDFGQNHPHRIVYWIPRNNGTVRFSAEYADITIQSVAFVPEARYRAAVESAENALRERWVEYFFGGDDLYALKKSGSLVSSNYIGPITFNGGSWAVEVRGRHLASATLMLEGVGWSNDVPLACDADGRKCAGRFTPSAGEAGLALRYQGDVDVYVVHPESAAPALDHGGRLSYSPLLGLKQSFSSGWLLSCPTTGDIRPSIYNYWLPGYAVPEAGCHLFYAPARMLAVGRLLSLAVLFLLATALVLVRRSGSQPARYAYLDAVGYLPPAQDAVP